jgi:hypothetical protein
MVAIHMPMLPNIGILLSRRLSPCEADNGGAGNEKWPSNGRGVKLTSSIGAWSRTFGSRLARPWPPFEEIAEGFE